jgi:sulfite exporter TauE/SafE
VAKLVAYTLLGFFLGWLGSLFQFSLKLQAGLLAFVALFMIGTALALLDVHPIFRFFIIQPPRFLTQLVRQQTKSNSVFAPAILGAFTIFIPCGTTQAMMALAVGSRSALAGAAILFTFVLGTFPLFFLIGYSMEWLKDILAARFTTVAFSVVVVMAAWNLNTAAVLSDSPVSLQRVAKSIYCTVTFCDTSPVFAATAPSRDVTITIQSRGYSVDRSVIPAGENVRLTLVNQSGRGCTQAFTIPRLGIQEVVPIGQSKTITFTAPKDTKELAFNCSMGMFGGTFFIHQGG